MHSGKPDASESQAQSIKSRTNQLYQAKPAPVVEMKKLKTVQDYLREAPATGMSWGLKASLGAGGGVILLLFAAVLLIQGRRSSTTNVSKPEPPETLIAREPEPPQQPSAGAASEDQTGS